MHHMTRGAESESESRGVETTRQESESGSESTKLPRLQLRNVLFQSVIWFPDAGENLDALFGNNLCRYCLKIL